MTIAIIGLGYVGLTLALALADKGIKVLGVEINPDAYTKLSKGIPTRNELGIDKYLKRNLGKNFNVFLNLDNLPEKPTVYIICVPTPIKNNLPNTDHLIKATKSIGKSMSGDELIIVRSTSPVGTTRKTIIPILEIELKNRNITSPINIVFAPERTAEGVALKELNKLPQIIGGINEDSSLKAKKLFRKLTPTVIQVSSLESAEMIKLIDNSFRDVRFAYANEIMLLCEKIGVDAHECITNSNTDYSRNNIPLPSPGVGGPCLSKDSYLLAGSQDTLKFLPNHQSLILAGRLVNESIPSIIAKKIKDQIKTHLLKDKVKIFVMGFAFKGEPETDDIRNSSTVDLVKDLLNVHEVYGHDPIVSQNVLESLNVIPTTIEDGFNNADCVIITNNHKFYRKLDIMSLLKKSSNPCLFVDCWRLFNKKIFQDNKSIIYSGIGVD